MHARPALCVDQLYLPSGSDDEYNLGFSLNKNVALSLCLSPGVNVSLSDIMVSFQVLLSVSNEDLSLLNSVSLCLLSLLGEFLKHLSISSSLFLYVFWDHSTQLKKQLVKICLLRYLEWGPKGQMGAMLRYDTSWTSSNNLII